MENQEQKKTSKRNVVVPALIIAGSLLLAYFMSGVGPAPVEYKVDQVMLNKIDSLEKANEKLMLQNANLDSLLEQYRDRIDDLDWKLSDLMAARKADQDKYHQMIEDALTQSDDSVYLFFKNRYNF